MKAASNIAAVCQAQLKELEPGKSLKVVAGDSIVESSCNFREMQLHPSEEAFFEQNKTKELVYETLKSHQDSVLSTEWELFPMPNVNLSSEMLATIQATMAAEGDKMLQNCAASLIRKFQGISGEVVTR